MMMMGLKFMGDVPFREVYIHGLVRDAQGQKMSKTKGNTIVPAEVQERYGTDAVRFTMAILAAPGNDIPLAPERMEGYRAFANKLWNATRFVLMKIGEAPPADRVEELAGSRDVRSWPLPERWILSRAEATREQVERALEAYRFDHAADALYHFCWHAFCDWYIECAKPALAGAEPVAGRSRTVLAEVLGRLLAMLHPFMPFITEELWQKLPGRTGELSLGAWPRPEPSWRDPVAESRMEQLQQLVVRMRNLRVESGVEPGRRVRVLLRAEDPGAHELALAERVLIAHLMRAEEVRVVEAFPTDLVATRAIAGPFEVALPLEGLLDLDAERARLQRELGKLEQELAARSKRLSNDSFLERAPPEVVEKERRAQRELAERKERLAASLATLGSRR
jgi:valyl-tRNA synthetase